MDLGARLKGRRILITGASSGLGAHFARLCAANGARAAVAARRMDRLEELVEDLRDAGAAEAIALRLDVSDETSVRNSSATGTMGGLDTLINNAGMASESLSLDQTSEDFDRVLDVNLRGVWLMATEAARYWRESATPGAIVNIASVLGLRVAVGVAPYAISKAGVVQLTKSLALELTRFNAIAPGYFATEINEGFFRRSARRGDDGDDQAHSHATYRRSAGTRCPLRIAGNRRLLLHDRSRHSRRWRPSGQHALIPHSPPFP